MNKATSSRHLDRRTIIKAAALAGVAQVASPFIIAARGESPVTIGLDNPLTGTHQALAVKGIASAAGTSTVTELDFFPDFVLADTRVA